MPENEVQGQWKTSRELLIGCDKGEFLVDGCGSYGSERWLSQVAVFVAVTIGEQDPQGIDPQSGAKGRMKQGEHA